MKKTNKLSKLNQRTANKRLGLLLVKSGIRAGIKEARRQKSYLGSRVEELGKS